MIVPRLPHNPVRPPPPLSLLCACLAVTENGDEWLPDLLASGAVDWPRLLHLAGNHLVTPSLAGALRRKGFDGQLNAEVRSYLDAIQAVNQDRNRILRRQLVEIAGALNRIDIQPLPLKGAIALLPDQYPGAEDRVVGDLDLLIPPDRMEDAAAAVVALGYRSACLEASPENHHSPPLLHPVLPVKVELHRRISHDKGDSALLSQYQISQPVILDAGPTVLVPDPMTRLLHNALHAQISDRHQRMRILNLRQLLEFAWLTRHYGDCLETDESLKRLRPCRHAAVFEYWAQAERWLGLPYPEGMPRSPRQNRELWLIERAASRRGWRRSLNLLFNSYDALRGEGLHLLPRRLANLVPRLWKDPEYFPRRLKGLLMLR